MIKVPTIFTRDLSRQPAHVVDHRSRQAERFWTSIGPGQRGGRYEVVPTIKWDGTSCRMLAGRLWKRYDCKKGKTPPENFEPAQDPDPVTGHWPGWLAVGNGPEDQWHREPIGGETFDDGTYELVGPKVQKNPYHLTTHRLIRHDGYPIPDAPFPDFIAIQEFLRSFDAEGIVWWHAGEPIGKIKRRDFGLPWPIPTAWFPHQAVKAEPR
jgi:hypothetical protein